MRKKSYGLFIILNIISIIIFLIGLFIIVSSFSFSLEKNKDKIKIIKHLNYKIEPKEESKYYDEKIIDERSDIIAKAISKINPHFEIILKTKNKENIKYQNEINATLDMYSNNKLIKTKKYELLKPEKINLEMVKETKIEKNLTINYEEYQKEVEETKKDTGKIINAKLTIEMTLIGKIQKEKINEKIKFEIPISNQSKKINLKKDLLQKRKILPQVKIKIKNKNQILGGSLIIIGSIVLFITSIIYIKRAKEIRKIRKRIKKLKSSKHVKL